MRDYNHFIVIRQHAVDARFGGAPAGSSTSAGGNLGHKLTCGRLELVPANRIPFSQCWYELGGPANHLALGTIENGVVAPIVSREMVSSGDGMGKSLKKTGPT
jgi:hypothetical protein